MPACPPVPVVTAQHIAPVPVVQPDSRHLHKSVAHILQATLHYNPSVQLSQSLPMHLTVFRQRRVKTGSHSVIQASLHLTMIPPSSVSQVGDAWCAPQCLAHLLLTYSKSTVQHAESCLLLSPKYQVWWFKQACDRNTPTAEAGDQKLEVSLGYTVILSPSWTT